MFSLKGRLLKQLRASSPLPGRSRRTPPLRVRGLEKRIVLDATIAVAGGSVDISGLSNDATINVTRETFNIDDDVALEDVYRFELSTGAWNDGSNVTLSGQVDLDGIPGAEAFVDGTALYVSAAFLQTNPGGLSVTGTGLSPGLVLETNITTAGRQDYGVSVQLQDDITLTASLVTFTRQVDGAGNSLVVSGDAVFGNSVNDTVTGLASLNVTGQATINTSTVTTSGIQTYTGPVVIGASAGTATLTTTNSGILFDSSLTLNSNLTVSTGTGDATFDGPINGPHHLLVNSTGLTAFNGLVGSTTPLASLTINGQAAINTSTVTTSGDQTYNGGVTIGATPGTTELTSTNGDIRFNSSVTLNRNLTVSAGDVLFDGAIDGTHHLEVDSTGQTFFNGPVGQSSPLASLAVSGQTFINTPAVTTSGSQLYDDLNIGVSTTLTSLNSDFQFTSSLTLNGDLTVSARNLLFSGPTNGPHHLVINSTGLTAFNGLVGSTSPLASLTTDPGGTTQINGGGITTTGNQLYGDDVQIGPGTQTLVANDIHFQQGVDGRFEGEGDLVITGTNSVTFDKPIGAITDPGSVRVRAVDVRFADGTFIEVAGADPESVHIVATGTLTLPVGFEVRAAFRGGAYEGVANTFLPRPAPGVDDTALVALPRERPIVTSTINLDQSATGTIDLVVGNTGERGLRIFVDWGDTVGQDDRFEGPGGWADGDGLGENDAPGDLFGIEGGATATLTHRYTRDDVERQLLVDNTFDVKYAVFQHEAIVIEAARVEQGSQSLGTPGGELNVLTTTMLFRDPAGPRFEPPPPATVPNLVSGEVAVLIPPPANAVPFEFPTERPAVPAPQVFDAPLLDPPVAFQQVTSDASVSSSPVVGRQQRFVLRLLSPDPTAPPLAEVELPSDSFRADRLQRLFQELPDGAYEIDLLLGENTERPILRFDIRQGRPVVPQESLDGGQLKLEEIEEKLNNSVESAAEPKSTDAAALREETTADYPAEPDSDGSEQVPSDENSSRAVSSAGTMSSWLEWRLRRPAAAREDGSLLLAGRLARRVQN